MRRASGLALGRLRLTVAPNGCGELAADVPPAPVDDPRGLPGLGARRRSRAAGRAGGTGAHKWADRRLLEPAEATGAVPLVLDARRHRARGVAGERVHRRERRDDHAARRRAHTCRRHPPRGCSQLLPVREEPLRLDRLLAGRRGVPHRLGPRRRAGARLRRDTAMDGRGRVTGRRRRPSSTPLGRASHDRDEATHELQFVIVMGGAAPDDQVEDVLVRPRRGRRARPRRAGADAMVIGAIGEHGLIGSLSFDGIAGRRADPAGLEAVQARLARDVTRADRDPGARAARRRRPFRPDRRAVHGRVARADADHRACRPCRRREHAARRGVQAADVAVQLPRARRRGAGHPRRGARGDRAAAGDRAAGPAAHRARWPPSPTSSRSARGTCRTSSCSPRSAGRDKPVLLKRGAVGHARGAADGRRVHPEGGQSAGDSVRARHPDVRDRDPLHARHRRRPGPQGADPPAGDR